MTILAIKKICKNQLSATSLSPQMMSTLRSALIDYKDSQILCPFTQFPLVILFCPLLFTKEDIKNQKKKKTRGFTVLKYYFLKLIYKSKNIKKN
jgi:hypothetical protein